MVSVLILDGFSDSSLCCESRYLSDICDMYVPILIGALRYNGVVCNSVKPSGLEYEYSITGKNRDNLIYVPLFTCADENSKVSFIYSDETLASSTSFRLASALRKLREETFKDIVFVNSLHENDNLKRFSPVIVDNIRCDKAVIEKLLNGAITKYAVTVAKTICDYYSVGFCNPFTP